MDCPICQFKLNDYGQWSALIIYLDVDYLLPMIWWIMKIETIKETFKNNLVNR